MPYQDDISKITNFTPYIETTPIHTLEMAGAQRQQQYNEGLQLIQQTNQQTKDLGSQLIGQQRQEYFNSKLSSIQNSLSGAIAGDLSNQGLVSSIGGAIKSIVNDDVVKAGIISSGTIKSGRELQTKLQGEGKAHANNDKLFGRQVETYATAPLLDENGKPTTFNNQYIPYTDYDKKLREIAEKLRSDNGKEQNDNPYRDKTTGAYTNSPANADIADAMQRKIFTGIDPAKLRLALETNLDDNDIRQMGIDGWAKYDGYDVNKMKEVATEHFKNEHRKDFATLQNLKLYRNTIDPKDFPLIDKKITQIETSLKDSKDNYDKSLNLSNSNLEQFKQYIFKEQHLANLANSYSNLKEETEIIQNPIKEVQLKNRDYNRQVAEFNVNKQFQERTLQLSAANISSEIGKREFDKAMKLYEAGLPVDLSQYSNGIKLDKSFPGPEAPAQVEARLTAIKLEADATTADTKMKEIKNVAASQWKPSEETMKKSPFEDDEQYKKRVANMFDDNFTQGVIAFTKGTKQDITNWTNNGNQMIAPYVKQTIEQQKIRDAATNLITTTKQEIENKYAPDMKKLNTDLSKEQGISKLSPAYIYSTMNKINNLVHVVNQGSGTTGIGQSSTVFDDEKAKSTLEPTEYGIYKAYKDRYYGNSTPFIEAFVNKGTYLTNKYNPTYKNILDTKDLDYDKSLKAKIFGAKPEINVLGTGANQQVVNYINNIIIPAQKGEGQHTLSSFNKAFKADDALAFAAEKKPMIGYQSIGDDVYINVTSTEGKTKGVTQTFDMTKDKFEEVFGTKPKELPSWFTVTKANGTTNSNTSIRTLNQATDNPTNAQKTAFFTSATDFPRVNKYKVSGDIFYKAGSTSEVIPVVYVLDPKTNTTRAISPTNFVDPNSTVDQFAKLTDANIEAYLK